MCLDLFFARCQKKTDEDFVSLFCGGVCKMLLSPSLSTPLVECAWMVVFYRSAQCRPPVSSAGVLLRSERNVYKKIPSGGPKNQDMEHTPSRYCWLRNPRDLVLPPHCAYPACCPLSPSLPLSRMPQPNSVVSVWYHLDFLFSCTSEYARGRSLSSNPSRDCRRLIRGRCAQV